MSDTKVFYSYGSESDRQCRRPIVWKLLNKLGLPLKLTYCVDIRNYVLWELNCMLHYEYYYMQNMHTVNIYSN